MNNGIGCNAGNCVNAWNGQKKVSFDGLNFQKAQNGKYSWIAEMTEI